MIFSVANTTLINRNRDAKHHRLQWHAPPFHSTWRRVRMIEFQDDHFVMAWFHALNFARSLKISRNWTRERRYTLDFRRRQWNFPRRIAIILIKKNQPPLMRTCEVRSLTTRVKVVVVNYSWSIAWNITSAATSRDFRIPLMVFPMSFNPLAIYV